MIQDQLDNLNSLRERGLISEEEYQKEKVKILNSSNQKGNLLGMDERTYCMVLHLSQLLGLCIVPLAGFIAPTVLWLMNKDQNATIDAHGKVVLNWIITSLIYYAIGAILTLLFVGIIVLIIVGIANIIFIIVGALKAKEGQVWVYPFSIKFF